MTLDLSDITKGLQGLSSAAGEFLMQNCIVCLTRHNHKHTGTDFIVYGDNTVQYVLVWQNIFDDQMDRTYKDQFDATEQGAYCLAILITIKQTNYTVIEKSARMNGFDYWLGDKGDSLFQRAARLEVSGIFNDKTTAVDSRYKEKKQQIGTSASLKLPGIIGIVEFSQPIAKFGTK